MTIFDAETLLSHSLSELSIAGYRKTARMRMPPRELIVSFHVLATEIMGTESKSFNAKQSSPWVANFKNSRTFVSLEKKIGNPLN